MPESAPAPVATLLEAANANDTDAFLAMFGEGGVVDDWGREFAGTDGIRTWSDREFIGKHVNLKSTKPGTTQLEPSPGGGPSLPALRVNHYIHRLRAEGLQVQIDHVAT